MLQNYSYDYPIIGPVSTQTRSLCASTVVSLQSRVYSFLVQCSVVCTLFYEGELTALQCRVVCKTYNEDECTVLWCSKVCTPYSQELTVIQSTVENMEFYIAVKYVLHTFKKVEFYSLQSTLYHRATHPTTSPNGTKNKIVYYKLFIGSR